MVTVCVIKFASDIEMYDVCVVWCTMIYYYTIATKFLFYVIYELLGIFYTVE